MKLFKKILVALVSAALLSAPFAASALTLDNVESSEEYVPTVVGDDGLTDTEWLKQQASEIYSDEYMAAFEEMAAMELTANNLRDVIDFFGLTESFGRDYAIDEELLGYFPNYTMEDIVWNFTSLDTSLMDMDVDAMGGTTLDTKAKRQITVSSITASDMNYDIYYNNEKVAITQVLTYIKDADLKIVPHEGFEISVVTLSEGYFVPSDGENYYESGWMVYPSSYFNRDSEYSIVLPGKYFGKSNETNSFYELEAGFYPFVKGGTGGGLSKVVTASLKLQVATKPLEAGKITFEEANAGDGSAIYNVVAGTISTNTNLTGVNTAITNGASTITVGSMLSVTVDKSKIAAAAIYENNSDIAAFNYDFTTAPATFTYKVGTADVKIVFTYKSTAKFRVQENGDFAGVTYTASVRSNGTLYNIAANDNATTLAAELSKYYAGDTVSITVNVPVGTTLGDVTYGGDSVTKNDNLLTLTLKPEAALVLNFIKVQPTVKLSVYNKNMPTEATESGAKFVVGYIDNYTKLTDALITDVSIDVVATSVDPNNKINEGEYTKPETFNAGRNGPWFAIGFEPKHNNLHSAAARQHK